MSTGNGILLSHGIGKAFRFFVTTSDALETGVKLDHFSVTALIEQRARGHTISHNIFRSHYCVSVVACVGELRACVDPSSHSV